MFRHSFALPQGALIVFALASVLVLAGCGKDKTKTSAAEASSSAAMTLGDDEEQRTLYAMGAMLAQPTKDFGFSAAEQTWIQMGFLDTMSGKEAQVELKDYFPKVQALAKAKMDAAMVAQKAESQVFLDAQAQLEGAEVTESGLIYTVVMAGEGASPTATDRVKVHYHGTLPDGTVFDSSVDRGEPIVFGLNQVIKCWTEGVQKMQVGGKSRLVCPSDIAYGDRGSPPKIKPGQTLIFDVELIDIEAPAES